MNNKTVRCFISACVVAALFRSVAPNIIAGIDWTTGFKHDDRFKVCKALINQHAHCPRERFPLVTPIFNTLLHDPVTFKKYHDEAGRLGVEYTCGEFRSFVGCLKHTRAEAVKECGDELGLKYKAAATFSFLRPRARLVTGITLCTSHYELLSKHFNCFHNFDLLSRVDADCDSDNKEKATQCLRKEINKTDNCKPGALELFNLFRDLSNEESEKK